MTKSLHERAIWWLARAGAVALGIMMALTFFDVLGRELFNSPIVGTVEVTELLMGMMIFLGIGLTTRTRGHIRVDILIMRLPARLQAFLEIITLAIAIVFTSLICWELWQRAFEFVAREDETQVWALPIYPFAFVIAVASLPLVTVMIVQFFQAVGVVAARGNSG